jgi:prepilin-type N-terminal cleavage/methylation domain-containing protein/prepilin-type processing-associated H-X9-DG protein
MRNRSKGFTLVELLVVIGIIALLISILLPALGKARESAKTIKCAANLHAIGVGMANYCADYKGFLPASNMFVGTQVINGKQSPTTPDNGYLHWSAFLFNNGYAAPSPYTIFQSTAAWAMFQCPSLDKGGLPPANTFAGNNDAGLSNEAPGGVIDLQAPRLAYTVNEALCPRGYFVQHTTFYPNNQLAYHFVQAGTVRDSSNVILATELWGIPGVMTADSKLAPGTPVSASRKPVSGITTATGQPSSAELAAQLLPTQSFQWAGTQDLLPDPATTLNPTFSLNYSTLDWVGRNHGFRKLGSVGGSNTANWDLRQSNFLYLDGHVETKHISQTVYPRTQWTEYSNPKFYTLQ